VKLGFEVLATSYLLSATVQTTNDPLCVLCGHFFSANARIYYLLF